MKLQAHSIALLKHRFWILWCLYLSTVPQFLSLTDSQLHRYAMRYSCFFTYMNLYILVKITWWYLNDKPCWQPGMLLQLLMKSTPICFEFIHWKSSLRGSCFNWFSDRRLGEWNSCGTRTTWCSSVKGRQIRRTVVTAKQQWSEWCFCCQLRSLIDPHTFSPFPGHLWMKVVFSWSSFVNGVLKILDESWGENSSISERAERQIFL